MSRNVKDVLFLPVTAQTVSQEEITALETKRIRRLRELGDWRPSSGFHIEPALPPETARQPEPALRPDAELSVLEGREVAQPPEQTHQAEPAPRRIRAGRATRSSSESFLLGMSGLRQSLNRV